MMQPLPGPFPYPLNAPVPWPELDDTYGIAKSYTSPGAASRLEAYGVNVTLNPIAVRRVATEMDLHYRSPDPTAAFGMEDPLISVVTITPEELPEYLVEGNAASVLCFNRFEQPDSSKEPDRIGRGRSTTGLTLPILALEVPDLTLGIPADLSTTPAIIPFRTDGKLTDEAIRTLKASYDVAIVRALAALVLDKPSGGTEILKRQRNIWLGLAAGCAALTATELATNPTGFEPYASTLVELGLVAKAAIQQIRWRRHQKQIQPDRIVEHGVRHANGDPSRPPETHTSNLYAPMLTIERTSE